MRCCSKYLKALFRYEELNLRSYPTTAFLKKTALLQAFLHDEPEIMMPDNENYFSMLIAKMGQEVSFQELSGKQKRALERKLRKAMHGIFKLDYEHRKAV